MSLSQKTSRTLYISQHYRNKTSAVRMIQIKEAAKRCVFSRRLKVPSVCDAVTLEGKLFQKRGAATKKARSPIVVQLFLLNYTYFDLYSAVWSLLQRLYDYCIYRIVPVITDWVMAHCRRVALHATNVSVYNDRRKHSVSRDGITPPLSVHEQEISWIGGSARVPNARDHTVYLFVFWLSVYVHYDTVRAFFPHDIKNNNNNNNNNNNDNFYGAVTRTNRFKGAVQNSTIVTAPNTVSEQMSFQSRFQSVFNICPMIILNILFKCFWPADL